MVLSEILNWILGASLLTTLIGLVTMRAKVREANAGADRAVAEADTVRITNTEQATRILIENIVEPLKQELDATRKELNSFKREVVKLRKAIADANNCRYSDDCPVLERMRDDGNNDRQTKRPTGQHRHGNTTQGGDGSTILPQDGNDTAAAP